MSKYADIPMDLDQDQIPGKIMARIEPASCVLEFGCAEGRMTRYMKEELGCHVSIVELNAEAFAVARQYAEDGVCGDIETGEWQEYFAGKQFDYILFADVLEHLRDPERALAATKDFLKPEGEVLLSLPNIGHNDVLVNLYLNRFEYTSIGLLDNTHVHFWGKNDLAGLAERTGYDIRVLDGVYQPPFHTEQRVDRGGVPATLTEALTRREYNEVYQFFLILRKRDAGPREDTEERLKSGSPALAAHFYWDQGEGYRADACALVEPAVLPGGRLRFYCDAVPEKCVRVRFDPTLGTPCLVSDIHVKTNRASCEIYPLNGVTVNQTTAFANTDPQMEFSVQAGTRWVEVEANIRLCAGYELEEVLSAVQELPACDEARRRLVGENGQLSAALNASQHEREALRGQVEAAARDNEALREQVEAAARDNNALREQVEAVSRDNEMLHEQAEAAARDNEALREQTEAAARDNDALREQAEAAARDNEALREQVEAASHDNETLREQAEAATRDNEALQEQAEAAARDNEALREQVEASARDNEALRVQTEATARDNETLRVQNVELAAQRDICKEHLDEREQHQDELELSLRQYQEENRYFRQLAHQNYQHGIYLEEQLQSISSSLFWRATRPCRAFLNAVTNTRAGLLFRETLYSLFTFGPGATARKIRAYLGQKSKRQEPAVTSPIDTIDAMAEQIAGAGGAVFGSLRGENGAVPERPVLLVSHELDLTGAPVALGYMAESLKRQGYFPVILSRHDGALRQEMTGHGIPAIVYEPVYQSDVVARSAHLFEFVVLCTNVGAPIAAALSGTDIAVVWWIHEAVVSYHPGALDAMPETLGDNVQVYCGGSYAEMILKRYRPQYQVRQLLYYVPDLSKQEHKQSTVQLPYAEGKTIFAVVGMQEERKGQDVLVQAIRLLRPELLKKCFFVFVGKPNYEPIRRAISSLSEELPLNVRHIPELNRDELFALYERIDCLVCTSKDDPMPIVVTEAMMMSKLIICSENTGSAGILEQASAGIVYRNNDPVALVQQIDYVCAHKDRDLAPMRERARMAYDRFFAQDVFDANVKEICWEAENLRKAAQDYDGTVSVVIPAYNGGEDMKLLLDLLRQQEGVGRVEIVVVDSGSSDGTPELAEQAGAKVIRIPNEEFSHSYARNLGASQAEGEYLLFMTQDARPNGTRWINGLLQPALREGVAAVSCRESPRPDCDLLGRASAWLHSEYMGILSSDRIMQMPAHPNYETLRRNGQLNDVTCLVKRDVFQEYQYRGDYAEDLDLGIRLIQSGYKLALLSKVCTIHSHNRPAFYHFKRCLVDMKTLKKILPDLPLEKVSEQTVVNRLVTAYCADTLYLSTMEDRQGVQEGLEGFCGWTEFQFGKIMDCFREMDHAEWERIICRKDAYTDETLQQFVLKIFQERSEEFAVDAGIAGDQFFFITHTLPRYFQAQGESFGEEQRQQIAELVFKHFGQMAGNLLAAYCVEHKDEKGVLNELEPQFSAGV